VRTDTDDADRQFVDRTLSAALESLPGEDKAILRMRFWESMTVADIARALCIAQKPLYRRIERALAEVRQYLEASGVPRERARELLGELEQ
jgi:RNA polymerase sigma factor for flagellar operon FliA